MIVPKHIRNFLHTHYGDPIVIKKPKAFEMALPEPIQKQGTLDFGGLEEKSVSLIVPERYYGMVDLMTIQDYCFAMFRSYLVVYVEACTDMGFEATDSCKKFLAKYGVTESDYALESALKMWHRHKNKPSRPKRKQVQKISRPVLFN